MRGLDTEEIWVVAGIYLVFFGLVTLLGFVLPFLWSL